MLQRINMILQKCMPFITPASVVIGVIFSAWLKEFVFLVPWIFAVMTFSGSLNSNFSDLRKVLRQPLPLLACLLVLHLVMPLIALGIGSLLFPGDSYTVTGLILSFVIPTGITSLIWVSIYKGHVVLTLSIILVDTLLAPFVVPYVLKIFVGTSVEMDVLAIMSGLFWMIVLPSLLGMLINQFAKKQTSDKLSAAFAPFTKVGIGLVVAINSSDVAPFLKEVNGKLLLIAVTVFGMAVLAYGTGFITGRLLKQSSPIVVSLTYNSGMRNISGGAVIAITYFPPPVAVPVIVGMLFQQILASFTGFFLSRNLRAAERAAVETS
ncbi:bile acid:sodium symporter family protein [Halobacillus salinarum]|uniref:Bile acid:sodium symporter family protein n=1 Tax=Halobacillus salinarum TaxID=2932257 RepID=A0ABY4EN02_9BACI|nr:bile acid:sodium symporter family protein [Halobacillus salinarum]UOQ45831.1 bile acid:sodium symporter family protein [Halobacillus salinarum]